MRASARDRLISGLDAGIADLGAGDPLRWVAEPA